MPTADGGTVHHFRLGLAFALTSALSFGMSGPFAKSLMDAGWSPTAAVIARLAGGAVVMAVFATLVRPQWPREALQHAQHGGALRPDPDRRRSTVLLQRGRPHVGRCGAASGIHRARHGGRLDLGHHPSQAQHVTLAGVALAIAGIMLVLNIFGGSHIDTTGVIWGLTAAVCAAFYFMMSDRVTADGSGLNSITLAAGGLIVGAVAVAVLGVVRRDAADLHHERRRHRRCDGAGSVPARARRGHHGDRLHAGHLGVARLRPSFASLVGLAEVLFAVLAAWVLLGEAMTPIQAVGGAVVLAGLALARQGDRTEKVSAVTWPDGAPVDEPVLPTCGKAKG